MKQAKTLTQSEFKRVMAIALNGRHAERNNMVVQLSYFAGLRVKEISSLLVGDVFTLDGEIKSIVTLQADQTKGKKGRIIVINKKLGKALSVYISYIKKLTPQAPLIQSQKGNSFSANSLCQLFMRLYKEAGLEGASSHSGRRTFITNLAHKGVSAKVLMTLSGHQHLSTTQRYIDVNDSMLLEAVELV